MGHYELEYPKDATNQVKRHNERASYALQTIHSLINSSPLLHVSFNDPSSPFPITLPMIGQMGSFDRPSADLGDVLELYLHTHASSRLARLCSSSSLPSSSSSPPSSGSTSLSAAASSSSSSFPSSSTAAANPSSPALSICITASHLDGIVLALSPFHHSYNYRSAILFGHASLVHSPAEKLYAIELITNGVLPSRYSHTRTPPTASELTTTAVLRVKIASGSAKSRSAGPIDDRNDLNNDALRQTVWTGVLPIRQVVGDAQPAEHNRAELSPHITTFINDFNGVGGGRS